MEHFLYFLKNGDENLVEFVLLTQSNLKKTDATSGQAIDFRYACEQRPKLRDLSLSFDLSLSLDLILSLALARLKPD